MFTVVILVTASLAVLHDNGEEEKGTVLSETEPSRIYVADITGVPAMAEIGIPLILGGAVIPIEATNNTITWSIGDSGTTGASLSENTLTVTNAGTLTLTASIGDVHHFTSVSAGSTHTAAIRDDGTLWTWGMNIYGQLGDGTTIQRLSPVQVGSDEWTSVSVGNNHTMAIDAAGKLWAWGFNSNGQLGDGTATHRSSPVLIDAENNWASVSAGNNHTMAIDAAGKLWAWGNNQWGKLGDGTTENRSSPVRIGDDTWMAVSAGDNHTVGIKDGGTMWAWGNNQWGKLGDGTTENRSSPVQIGKAVLPKEEYIWKEVSAGTYHTMAIKEDNTLWAWGVNWSGQLGTGLTKNVPSQVGTYKWTLVSAGDQHTTAIKEDGTLWAWGDNWRGQLGDGTFINKPNPVTTGTEEWIYVSAGWEHTMAIKKDGTLWAWGCNDKGQFGNGVISAEVTHPVTTTTNGWKMISAGKDHTVGIKHNGTMWSWGDNWLGQLGLGNPNEVGISKSAPEQIGTAEDWAHVSVGSDHTMAIKTDGTMWAWGNNMQGQLGLSYYGFNTHRTEPTQVGTAKDWRSVSAGAGYTLAIKGEGELWAWGYNGEGQLGLGSDSLRYTQTRIGSHEWKSVSAGDQHTVAIRSDGTLWAWGNNASGQLGVGGTEEKKILRSNTPAQVGSDKWKMVSAGGDHTVGIKENGSLWAWGNNASGQLGNGSLTQRASPTLIGTGEWISASAGTDHTTAVKKHDALGNTLWTWGSNRAGQLGDGTATQRTSPVQIGSYEWKAVSAGGDYTIAVKHDDSLWSWGNNRNYQLGIGDTFSPSHVGIMGFTKEFTIKAVSPNAYAVTYNVTGGTGIVPTANVIAGTAFSAAPITNITPPSGKFFMNWNTLADGSGTSFAAGTTITMPSNPITLYAVWGNVTHTAVTQSDEWVRESSEGFAMTVSGFDHRELNEVRVNGVTIGPLNYTVTSGSVIVTLSPGYLATLGTGTHNIDLIFGDSVAAATLTILPAENEFPLMLVAIAAIAVVGITAACFMFVRNKP